MVEKTDGKGLDNQMREIYEFLQKAVDDLKKNPIIGKNIPKNLIPKE